MHFLPSNGSLTTGVQFWFKGFGFSRIGGANYRYNVHFARHGDVARILRLSNPAQYGGKGKRLEDRLNRNFVNVSNLRAVIVRANRRRFTNSALLDFFNPYHRFLINFSASTVRVTLPPILDLLNVCHGRACLQPRVLNGVVSRLQVASDEEISKGLINANVRRTIRVARLISPPPSDGQGASVNDCPPGGLNGDFTAFITNHGIRGGRLIYPLLTVDASRLRQVANLTRICRVHPLCNLAIFSVGAECSSFYWRGCVFAVLHLAGSSLRDARQAFSERGRGSTPLYYHWEGT